MRKSILLITGIVWVSSLFSQSLTVPTQRYDNLRLGWNKKESILNTTNVNPSDFGLLFSRSVDDQIYAQPLLVSDLSVNGSKQNVVFVATVNNSVYAFNADDSATAAPLWHINLTSGGARVIKNTDMTDACGGNYTDFTGNMGIVGTPVIDTITSTLYVVSRDVTLSGQNFQQFIHAIDIHTGLEKQGSPVYITADVPGSAPGNVNKVVSFDEQKQNQRPALLLYQGIVYITWASHCDWQYYHGWMIGYDAATLQRKVVYNVTPDGIEGGIWMSGTGPVVGEDGFIYLTTGNGTVGVDNDFNNVRNRGESLLKLKPSGDSVIVNDFFTPSNFEVLEAGDLDYGISGPLLIPGTNLSLSGSKEGILYLIDDTHMGRYTANDDSVVQVLQVVANPSFPQGFIHGTPVYYHYQNPSDSEFVYVWAASDSITQYVFNRSQGNFDIGKTLRGKTPLNSSLPGAMLSVSSHGLMPGTGLVWASHPTSGNANEEVRPGTLDVFDARDVRKHLWSSDEGPSKNRIGSFAKFNTPVVANGKVYMATFSNTLNIYGLFHTPVISSVINDKSSVQFAAYPNPAGSSVTLQYSLTKAFKDLTANITDVEGRILLSVRLDGSEGDHSESIELGNKIEPGVYTIVYASENNRLGMIRLVKL